METVKPQSDAADKPADDGPATALEVAARFEMSDAARALLRPEQSPSKFFSLLAAHELFPDAIRFAAYYLPKREAIWWGSLCLWHMLRPEANGEAEPVPPPEQKALDAIVGWVREPNETNRRAVYAAREQAKANKALNVLSLAVYSSGGSISFPDLPEVEPGEFATNQMVAAAVLIASRSGQTRAIPAFQKHFLTLAQAVDQGEVSWLLPEETPTPAS